MKHLNELSRDAAAGNRQAELALRSLLYVPHHLRARRKGIKPRTGYSGDKANIYAVTNYKAGLHVTAKTHRGVRTIDALTVSPDYGLDRLQVLKERHA